jgi:hypothetical protein
VKIVESMKTIGVELWAGQARGGPNHATCFVSIPRLVAPLDMKALFVGAYTKFAGLCRDVDEPGLALLAVDLYTGKPAGLVRMRARFGRHVAAIVGRHDQCDLYLSGHNSLALRHLAVILDPVQSWRRNSTAVRFRVLDLRTETGFTDEHGKAMGGLLAEGPAFMRCSGHAIFVLPIGDPTDWPESASDAWAMLPERVYIDELPCDPQGSLRMRRSDDRQSRRSMIFRTHGPRDTATGLSMVERGDIAGTLEMIGIRHRGIVSVGERALRDGILVGRYARCDSAAIVDDSSLSRVHVMFIRVDDTLLAIDTASRNGTHLPGGAKARVITLDGIDSSGEIHLGKHTRVRWRWSD